MMDRANQGIGGQATPLAAALLAAAYALAYLADPALPGNLLAHPEGWWGWFDQGQTIKSTLALVRGDLQPGAHWYPLGYALLGAPFALAAPNHPFFLPGLLSLMVAMAAFVALARRAGLATHWAAPLFAATVLSHPDVLRCWTVPWNTTPAAALTWLLLAGGAAWLQGVRRPFLVGLGVAALGACRPTDLLMAVPCLAVVAWDALRRRDGRALLWVAAGGLAVSIPYGALHAAIYGLARSPYMSMSQGLGFTLHDFGWKAYVLLVDPSAWFQDGAGMFRRLPWLVLGCAGLLPALLRGPVERLLAATLLLHAVLYLSYVDLLPTGLWRYHNVHYFAWALPGYGLLIALLLRDAAGRGRPARRAVAAGSVVGTVLLSCLRLEPEAAGAGPAKMVEFAGPQASFPETYFSGAVLRDGAGPLPNISAVRAFPIAGGMRVVGLRRDVQGLLEWEPGALPAEGPQARSRIGVGFGWPRWLRRNPWRSVLPS